MDFGNKSPLKKYVRDLGCAPYLSFIRTCLIWENLVGYGFLVLLVIVDYAVVLNTEFTTLTYICLFALEMYWCNLLLTYFKALDTSRSDDTAAIDYFFKPWDAFTAYFDKFFENEQIKQFSQQSIFYPFVTTILLLVLALLFHIIKGPFVAFITIVCILVLPGLCAKGYDEKAYDYYQKNIEPKIKEMMNNAKKAAEEKKAEAKEAAASTPAPATEVKQPEKTE